MSHRGEDLDSFNFFLTEVGQVTTETTVSLFLPVRNPNIHTPHTPHRGQSLLGSYEPLTP